MCILEIILTFFLQDIQIAVSLREHFNSIKK
jgi:hypothetical protein